MMNEVSEKIAAIAKTELMTGTIEDTTSVMTGVTIVTIEAIEMSVSMTEMSGASGTIVAIMVVIIVAIKIEITLERPGSEFLVLGYNINEFFCLFGLIK